MFEILSRCSQRPWAHPERVSLSGAPAPTTPFILHMQENRSHLSEPARRTLAMMALLFMAGTILPALKGHLLVPAYAMTSLAGLTFALHRHAGARPLSETLEFAVDRLCHRSADGRTIHLPASTIRFHAEETIPASLRLFLSHSQGGVEIARCLGLEERRAVVPLIAAGLAHVRGAGR